MYDLRRRQLAKIHPMKLAEMIKRAVGLNVNVTVLSAQVTEFILIED